MGLFKSKMSSQDYTDWLYKVMQEFFSECISNDNEINLTIIDEVRDVELLKSELSSLVFFLSCRATEEGLKNGRDVLEDFYVLFMIDKNEDVFENSTCYTEAWNLASENINSPQNNPIYQLSKTFIERTEWGNKDPILLFQLSALLAQYFKLITSACSKIRVITD